jgi:hypothetical protein
MKSLGACLPIVVADDDCPVGLGICKPFQGGPRPGSRAGTQTHLASLTGPTADSSGSGGAVREQMRDEAAQIVGARLERVCAVEDVDQPPGGSVGADGGIAAVLGAQGMGPLAQQERVGVHRGG